MKSDSRHRRIRIIIATMVVTGLALSAVALAELSTTRRQGGNSRFLPLREWGFGSSTICLIACGPSGSTSTPVYTCRKYGFYEVETPCAPASPCGK